MAKFNFGKSAKRNAGAASNNDGAGSGNEGSDPFNPVDPDSLATGSDGNGNDGTGGSGEEQSAPKRRGRPPGTRNKTGNGGASGKAKVSVTVTGIEKTLLSLHMIAATITATPELTLEDAEAKAIAEAINNVSDHYAIPGIDEGPASIVMLVGTLLAIYGKRYMLLRAKKNKPAKSSSENSREENNVSQFPMASSPGSMFGIGAA